MFPRSLSLPPGFTSSKSDSSLQLAFKLRTWSLHCVKWPGGGGGEGQWGVGGEGREGPPHVVENTQVRAGKKQMALAATGLIESGLKLIGVADRWQCEAVV